MRSIFRSSLLFVVACYAVAAHSQPGPYRGRPVQVVIDELRAAGLPLVYSSNLVPSDMVVLTEPSRSEPLALAREILQPHGLAIRESAGSLLIVRSSVDPLPVAQGSVVVSVVVPPGTGPVDGSVQADAPAGPRAPLVGGRAALDLASGRHVLTVRASGYLPERVTVSIAAGATAAADVSLIAAAPKLDELTVTASRYDLIKEIQPSAAFFSRDEIEALSELGDDTLRITHRLPGIASNEFSARSHVRGGATDETSVIFDGMRLVEPFHLRDYQSVFSAIDQRIVSGIQIYSGGFPAEYGDSLSGLTVIEQREPTELHQELGLSLLYTSALTSGTFRGDRGTWLVSVRRGNVDQLLNSNRGEPSYGDAFMHVATELGAEHRLALNAIGFDDDVVFKQGDPGGAHEEGYSATDTSQVWLKLDSDWSAELSSRTLLYSTRFVAERAGIVDDASELLGTADDRRFMSASGIKQEWEWDLASRQALSWGFEAGQLDGTYRYSSVAVQTGVLATLGSLQPQRSFALAPGGESYSAYVSDRVRVTDRLIADLGMRWDRQTYLPPGDDEQFSPRVGLLYRLGAKTDLRLSYGRFFQAEGLVDLQVEDGVLEFAPAQSATHAIAGLEQRFDNQLALRLEVFRKWTSSARPRYENLFDPLDLLPELRPGRIQVSPDQAESRGLELVLSGEQPFSWWANYTIANVDDIIGADRVPRAWDQRHAASGGASFDSGAWTLSFAVMLHTGWPATTVSLETVPGPGNSVETIAVAGERNAERLGSLRRIDFRASRPFMLKLGSLRFFAEVTNVMNRDNPCCVGYDAITLPDGTEGLERVERNGLPLTGNVGVLWEF